MHILPAHLVKKTQAFLLKNFMDDDDTTVAWGATVTKQFFNAKVLDFNNICRYCLIENGSKFCSQCKSASYCSKSCEIKDFKKT